MYCSHCKRRNNIVSEVYGKTEYIVRDKCKDTIGSEEQQHFSEAMLEALSYETLNLEVFVPLTRVPKKFAPLYPKHMPMLETADVVNIDIVPSLFLPNTQYLHFLLNYNILISYFQ